MHMDPDILQSWELHQRTVRGFTLVRLGQSPHGFADHFEFQDHRIRIPRIALVHGMTGWLPYRVGSRENEWLEFIQELWAKLVSPGICDQFAFE